ncbi:PREDICTED: EF-hand domain-containing family member C2-like [Amphimedon queenslandica]|uniref:EF-hand domain-containing family member C2 n=1 Tax=Amphimedon queenslandica TaxID=400682 RepID=A0A1X7U599_AMPQE|nr:PREDICTED: EF-hand domain-containing family member C2-like [Amphimedon queenslandica]|eukprot:XP_003389005.1 PREDICTED: EF-hand domain-containing family member C2-like [Amphimedon queenslandica]
MALPLLPGNSFDKNLGRTNFHKAQFFDYNADVPVNKSAESGGQLDKNRSVYPEGVDKGEPAWVAFDRQVLRFNAYFQEGIEEKREEQFRVRNCVILFYLEDDSVQVNEKQIENSGIPQGTLIRRHRIPLPPPDDDKFYTVEHFNIGHCVQLYSKMFQITGCDQFTKNFLAKLGSKVPPAAEAPSDPYSEHRDKMIGSMQPHRPYERLDTLRQFLDCDRQVLRFYCLWDDTDSTFGDPHELVLHYYLADDTIEILEKIPQNSGRDSIPVFLRREKLPKNPPGMYQPGVQTKRTVLNVFGPTGHGGRYILDALKTGAVHNEYYHETDLTIGAVLNVWGRKVLLCDCDDFTKNFYSTKYNVGKFEPIQFPASSAREIKNDLPPYTGFGSEEDSLSSCLHLIPKAPRKDHAKFMEKDRQGLKSNVLRFVACLNSNTSTDIGRKFIVSYYLSDDTLTVYEPPIRNSGIIGGKFLERCRVAKPKANESDPSVYYQPEDFYIGAEVVFNNFSFILTEADEYAMRYMESNSDQFPHANINLILSKLKGPATAHIEKIKTAFNDADIDKKGFVTEEEFKTLVKGLAHGLLNEHEVLTLCRYYKTAKRPPLASLTTMVQADLKKNKFQKFSELESVLKSLDTEGSGYLPTGQVLHGCQLLELPVSDQLIEASMENCQKSKTGILYQEFLQLVNWVEHPVEPQDKLPENVPEEATTINYTSLIEDLTAAKS